MVKKTNKDLDRNMKRVFENPKIFPDKYTIYTCDIKEMLDRKDIPDTVTIDMNDPEAVQNMATDIKGRKYLCKKFLRSKKVSQLRKTLKSLSHKAGRISRKLENVT